MWIWAPFASPGDPGGPAAVERSDGYLVRGLPSRETRVRVTPEEVSRLGEAFPSLAWPSTRKAETPAPVGMA